MSLFTYTVYMPDLSSKSGQVTAKTEAEAKRKILEMHPKATHHKVQGKEEPEKKAVKKVANKVTNLAQAKGLTKLEKYLYLQHGKCFFCGEGLTLELATIEHLNPVSKGGKRTEDNEVVCCATVNHTFGDMDLKRKFEFVLRSAPGFRCDVA